MKGSCLVSYMFCYSYCRKRCHNAPRMNMLNETTEQDKTKEISTDMDQVYETVDVHSVQPREMGQAGSERAAEAIYKCPL